APAERIASSTAGTTPWARPRRPACATPTTPASTSARSTGTQSATRTPSPTPAATATIASASPTESAALPRSVTTATSVPCTWLANATGAPSHAPARARLARTRAASSVTLRPRLRDCHGSGDTPPARVVKPARTPGPRSTSSTTGGAASSTPPLPCCIRPTLIAARDPSLEEVRDVELLDLPARGLLVEDPRRDLDAGDLPAGGRVGVLVRRTRRVVGPDDREGGRVRRGLDRHGARAAVERDRDVVGLRLDRHHRTGQRVRPCRRGRQRRGLARAGHCEDRARRGTLRARDLAERPRVAADLGRAAVEARRDHRDAHLVAQRVVDHRAEDDVRLGVRRL